MPHIAKCVLMTPLLVCIVLQTITLALPYDAAADIAPTPGVCSPGFLSFQTGAPGEPGDGVLSDADLGGSFVFVQPISLADFTKALTVTIFLPPESPHLHAISFGFVAPSREPPCNDTFGAGAGFPAGTIFLKGVEGVITAVPYDAASYVQAANQLLPGCNFVAADLFMFRLGLHGDILGDHLTVLDAAAFCLGDPNTVPQCEVDQDCDDGNSCNGSDICNSGLCSQVEQPAQADTDGDGVSDVCDNCPSISNDDQADADGDGIGDRCDACTSTAPLEIADHLGCGCADKSCDDGVACNGIETCDSLTGKCVRAPYPPECDRDRDGNPKGKDNCPTLFNPKQKDSDSDGIGDACDNCRTVKNSAQTDSDEDGIGDACQPAALPTISSASPSSASAGSVVVIKGKKFGPSQGHGRVHIGLIDVDSMEWSATTIKLVTPDLDFGRYNLQVFTSAGGSNTIEVEVSPDETRKSKLQSKITRFLQLALNMLHDAELPQDYTSLGVLYATLQLDSYESLFMQAVNEYNLAITAGLLAKNATKAGRLQLGEQLLGEARLALSNANETQLEAIAMLNGELVTAEAAVRLVKQGADITVGCLAPLSGFPKANDIYKAVDLVARYGADLYFNDITEANKNAVVNATLFILGNSIKARGKTLIESSSLHTEFEAAMEQPDFDTVFVTAVAKCGVTIGTTLIKPYLRDLVDAAGDVALR